MRYKIGDRVKVREDLIVGRKYGGVCFVEGMKELLGKVVEISGVFREKGYGVRGNLFGWTDEMFEGKVEMTKDDLKTGMIVTLRNGEEYMVVLNHVKHPNGLIMSFTGEMKWDELNSYTDDLLCRGLNCAFDIVKVQIPTTNFLVYETRDTLWEREEVKKITMKEVEEKFGCKVEIID